MFIQDSKVLCDQDIYALFRRQIKLHDGCFEAFCVDIKQFSKLQRVYGSYVADQIAHMMLREVHHFFAEFGELARIHPDQVLVCVPMYLKSKAEVAFNALLASLENLRYVFNGRRIRMHFIATQVLFSDMFNPYNVMDIVMASMREAGYRARKVSASTRFQVGVTHGVTLLERARIIRSLKRHCLPPELTLAWQPMVYQDKANTRLHAEALLRLKTPTGNLESANFLLDACIQSGQTAFLDNWVITSSLEFLSCHEHELTQLGMLSVNVSPCSLNDDHFLQDTLALLQRHPMEAKKLCLEITEVGSVFNFQQVQGFVSKCRQLGVRIGLDDFGAGYSNFRYAIDLKLDVIKIDGAIVRTICHNKSSRAVVAAIARLAEDLGCECVAEWVEDLHTLRALQGLNIKSVQGYFFAPAMAPERFFNVKNLKELLCEHSTAQSISGLASA